MIFGGGSYFWLMFISFSRLQTWLFFFLVLWGFLIFLFQSLMLDPRLWVHQASALQRAALWVWWFLLWVFKYCSKMAIPLHFDVLLFLSKYLIISFLIWSLALWLSSNVLLNLHISKFLFLFYCGWKAYLTLKIC